MLHRRFEMRRRPAPAQAGRRRAVELFRFGIAMALAVPPCRLQAQALPSAPGAGDLMVVPTRIVFEGHTRAAEVSLVNIGSQTSTYRISLVHMRMTEDGAIHEMQEGEAGGLFADALLRYAPHQVVLEPGVAQTVRIQVRIPAQLQYGEYRSHLMLRAVPHTGREARAASAPPPGVRIQLTPLYAISIPVIVRYGDTSAIVSLRDMRLEGRATPDGTESLQLALHRTGNRSTYGNLKVTFAPKRGKRQDVVVMNGVAVYTPNLVRRLRVPLRTAGGVPLRAGQLRVEYTGMERNGGPPTLATIELP